MGGGRLVACLRLPAYGFIAIGSLVSIACTFMASMMLLRLLDETIVEARSIEGALAPSRQATARLGEPEPPVSDFAQKLPDVIGVQPMLLSLRRSAADSGATFIGVQVQQRPATKEALARTDLAVSLRGAYPKLAQVLTEALGRYPNATLARASLRRAGSPDQVEATFVIGLWGAPTVPQTTMSAGARIPDAASSPVSAWR